MRVWANLLVTASNTVVVDVSFGHVPKESGASAEVHGFMCLHLLKGFAAVDGGQDSKQETQETHYFPGFLTGVEPDLNH